MLQHKNGTMPTAFRHNVAAQKQSGFTLPCDFSDSDLNLPFSRAVTASVLCLLQPEGE